ncbi:TIGR04255 family protein [Corynebacterium glutamicum]|uniref:TIGR04255 family protein n=1 Tax=Corynebacterium glutamicum TaxID=1718 RepID=UPI00146848E4|nr:TIGR04255 family protein [Corynebacterium glutamicum]GFK19182.1 hypothetical protein KbCgl_17540 [Corynebacterium glutamicum]GFK19256.1 hypothetical protein KbCgl_18280 [Corynebacterium glutamicum]
MTDRVRFRPFTGDSERRVSMIKPPLELVLVQIRWPEHAGRLLRDFDSLALDFGDQLKDFPLFNEITEQGIQITPEGMSPIQGSKAYQWRSVDDIWTVHLTKLFVSVFCVKHENYSYSSLEGHLVDVTRLMEEVLGIRTIERVGVRYVNRISDPELLGSLTQVFDPAVLGFEQLATRSDVSLESNVTQGRYSVEDVLIQARSGILPPSETLDPAIPPLGKRSWVLDLDASHDKRTQYDPLETLCMVGRLADAAYDFFKLVLREDGPDKLDGAK